MTFTFGASSFNQDDYQRSTLLTNERIILKEKWTDLPMLDCGFSGKWFELKHSYRLPETVKDFASVFAKNYLPSEMQNLPSINQSELALEDCNIKWISIIHHNAIRSINTTY